MKLSITSRREQLSRNIRGRSKQTDDIPSYNQQLDNRDLREVEMREGAIATVYEEGTRYEILKYSFVNPNDESEIFEIRSGSLVTLKNDQNDKYFIAEINYLYFYNDEDDNVHIEANFESLEEEEIPNWASLDSIVHVNRSIIIE